MLKWLLWKCRRSVLAEIVRKYCSQELQNRLLVAYPGYWRRTLRTLPNMRKHVYGGERRSRMMVTACNRSTQASRTCTSKARAMRTFGPAKPVREAEIFHGEHYSSSFGEKSHSCSRKSCFILRKSSRSSTLLVTALLSSEQIWSHLYPRRLAGSGEIL